MKREGLERNRVKEETEFKKETELKKEIEFKKETGLRIKLLKHWHRNLRLMAILAERVTDGTEESIRL